ncbi:hypothetical protein BDZ88DRAFT_448471 [Geranomyces variabilis]|nr:hypothetical protein BDZ88DRAFT_448471 [Geranomyces variabilis]KAJ3143370.1 hypothetical protein HDU90_000130 [Geranomyces variabilis]
MQLPTPIDDNTIPSICEDFSYFKKALQESRSLDDNATPRLNALTTRSPDVKESCMFFENALNSAYRDRERLIAGCLKISRDKIAQKRARLEADPANQDLRAAITVDESEVRSNGQSHHSLQSKKSFESGQLPFLKADVGVSPQPKISFYCK